MMLKRKIEKEIMHWIESSDKALLIYGVRQAGKTFIIRECLKAAGCDYIEFNLIRQPEIVEILAGATSIDDLILKLSLYSDQKIVPCKTVFFFDEIQKYKEIVTKIKFLVDDKRFRYILSGSLLGVEIVNLKSAPVGYLQTLTMYPLDFEEFLQIFRPVELDEACRSLRHVKTVARGEFGIVKFSYHICKVRNYFVNLNVFDKRGQNDFTRSAGRRKQRM